MARFTDNVVLITGAGRGRTGDGAAIRAEGANIVAADIEAALAESTAERLGMGRQCLALKVE
jgi:NAD(P)-dependent dehydrogenase (short-subunit alcohol dehydrogenase family)